MTNLAGLHDRESVALGVTGTWALDTIALSENPPPKHYEVGYEWLVRCNWGYGSTGTLPVPAMTGEYLARLAAYVRGSRNCHRWIIGNEPNLSREWPDGQPIFPWLYADCYKAARRIIHNQPGHERDEVLIAASGPWNADLKYPGNADGDWIKYFADVLNTCYGEMDGVAIHSYTHGYDVALVTSEARMQPPFQHRHYEFRAYRDYLGAIPDHANRLPVYLTEANGNGPWQAVGLMPAMLQEIDSWNQTASIKVNCVIFYRYPRYDEYAIEGRGDVISEYKAAVGRGYTSPVENMTNFTHSPSTPTQPAPDSREIDPRLVQRGVTIETPPLQPGQEYWRVKAMRWFSEQEAGGRHHIYVEAVDDDGVTFVDVPFAVWWPSGAARQRTKGGRGFDAGNFAMSPSLNEFSVKMVDGTPSETVRGIGMGADGNPGIHTATLVTFELATVAQAQPQPAPGKPEPSPQPQPVAAGILDPLMLEAIVLTESAGSGYGEDGRLKIRLEAHLLLTERWGNPAVFQPYFRFNKDNILHAEFRHSPGGPWVMFHNSQALEWQAFEFARSLDEGAALRCISMGAGQVMGFNHARVGYATPRLMFEAFQRSELAQSLAVVNYCLADANLVKAIRQKDVATIIRLYNGVGMEAIYRPRLEGHYRRLGGVL